MKTYKSSSLMSFRFLSLIIAIQFLTFQSFAYAGSEIPFQPDSQTQPSISVNDFQASNSAKLPNPNDFNASVLTPYSFTPISGSVIINDGSVYTNQQNVTLHFQVSGGEMPADGNNNGVVDAADYVIWRDHSSAVGAGPNSPGDYDKDGDVDGNDYLVWRQSFGNTHGITQMAFSTDGTNFSAWEAYQASKDWNFSGGDGQKTVYVKFRDSLNDESSIYSGSINVDTTLPSSNFAIRGSNTPDCGAYSSTVFTCSTLVLLDIYPSDGTGSGLDKMRFSEDGGNTWSDWQTTVSAIMPYTFFDGTNGLRELRMQLRDQAQNVATFSSTIFLDTVRPQLSVQPNDHFVTNSSVRKTITVGPVKDQEGDDLNYGYDPATTSSNLISNGNLSFYKNQLMYTPNDGFTGSGTITVVAGDIHESGYVTINLEVKNPSFNYSNDPQSSYQLDKVNAVRAWNLSRGTNVKIGILDTGIDMDHPDLDNNIDYADAYDFIDHDNNPTPSLAAGNDHGTHVAGIAAAENNGTGISGIAPGASIVPIRIGDPSAYIGVVIDAINSAVTVGVKVINLSFGGLISGLGTTTVQLLQNAIDTAYANGVTVVAAAGNDNGANANNYAPAGLNHVISVSSTTQFDTRSSFSNTSADFSAPGSSIYSTVPNDTYTYKDGTSMSTPLVSGLVALILSQDPLATPDDIFRRLKYSAKDLGTPGQDIDFGWGRIDAFKALSYDYWNNGATIKTQWLEEPDEHGYVKLNFGEDGLFVSGETAQQTGFGGLAGLGAALTSNFITSSFNPNPEEIASHLEDFPRLVSTLLPASVTSTSRHVTPLFWSALGAHQGLLKVSDFDQKELRSFNSKSKKLPRK